MVKETNVKNSFIKRFSVNQTSRFILHIKSQTNEKSGPANFVPGQNPR